VSRAVDPRDRVLMEHAALLVLTPRLVLHRIVTYELQHAETVVGGIDARR